MKRFFALLSFSLLFALGAAAQMPTLLDADDFARRIFETPAGVVLDVRTPGEFSDGHLRNARNINLNDANFEKDVNVLDKTKPVFVYCLGGSRSATAAAKMRSWGFSQVYELDGGILKWRASHLPEDGAPMRGMTLDQFNNKLLTDKLVLVDFYAEWCGPCKAMKPYLEEIAKEKAGTVEVLRIDVDQNPELATAMQVRALPTVVLYKGGKVKWWNVGYVPKKTVLKQLK